MPLPIAPIAVTAARLAIAGAALYAATRTLQPVRRDQRAEDALDDLPEGVAFGQDAGRDGPVMRGTARFRRVIRLGDAGPGVAVDFTGLARLRIRRA